MSSSQVSDALSKTYQKKTEKEHILSNPDTYIGSIDMTESNMWMFDSETNMVVNKIATYNPGMYKLFDEAIVNCRDHVVRMIQKNGEPVTYIDISINDSTGEITMTNDGNGIDVERHPEYNVWIPELIFANLRTSTNYDKSEKKIVGGKNGFGSSLILIWSTYAMIETVDSTRKLKYTQSFRNNLDTIEQPIITKCNKKSYTKISFIPDYVRLGFANGLTSDMRAIFHRRVYDISAVTDKSVRVKYNSTTLSVKTFKQYIDLYIGKNKRVYEASENGRWEYAVTLSPNHEFSQVSFVNGIYTAKGGKHVDYLVSQIVKKCIEYISAKKKTTVTYSSIKEHLMIFIRCDIENPSFDSQTKENMTTPFTQFGSRCIVSDNAIKNICTTMNIMDSACAITELRETNQMKRETDGSKTRIIRGIPKYDSANWAGTAKSNQCTLLLCEGSSAKSGVMSGLSSSDRNIYGIYPLKGKLINVRDKQTKKIGENAEIADIKKILGLETGYEYKSIEDVHKKLRYSQIVFLTDQDLDGSHIKGLCINLFACEWNSLLKIPGFIGFMNTPILTAKKGKHTIVFYNNGEYESWKQLQPNGIAGWKIKYYKGLGTSTKIEFEQYFKNKKIVHFEYTPGISDDTLDMVFNKTRADARKDWLGQYDRNKYLDTNLPSVSYEGFVNNELIHFSKYDCDRNIPNIMDGLKTSLRKILYSAFKKGLTHEIKVAQLIGYVSEQSCYHHGESSLAQAIIGLAQNFVGSNNISLLYPSGQFGTRLAGGEDHASERYIFTRLQSITRCIYPEQDFPILNYLDDDGTPVEPIYYVPIIPMILVNGSKGIGTGFSTEILCYNPLDIIDYIKSKLSCRIEGRLDCPNDPITHVDFTPYYEGFKGQTMRLNSHKYMFKGTYTKNGSNQIHITELPVGVWTQDYKEFLDNLSNKTEPEKDKDGKKTKIVPLIKEVISHNSDVSVNFTVIFNTGKLAELEAMPNDPVTGLNGIEKSLKLYSTKTTTNMNLFNAQEHLQKYDTVQSIVDDYFETRLQYYGARRKYLIDMYESQMRMLSNKARYITETLDNTIDLRKKTKEQICSMLVNNGYAMYDGINAIDMRDNMSLSNMLDGFTYLTKMPMDSVSDENVTKLNASVSSKQTELDNIRGHSNESLWMHELNQFRTEYLAYKQQLRCN